MDPIDGSWCRNAHVGLTAPARPPSRCSLVRGDYLYAHYGCDGTDDRGWGCGYRTLQTLASWLRLNVDAHARVPTLPEIQRALVAVGDKPASFLGSKEWIGTVEASLALDHLFGVPCRLVHVRRGGAHLERAALEELHGHFEVHGSPVMMGGDRDNSSKGVLGVCSGEEGSFLLVADPHYYGPELGPGGAQRGGWVAWKRVSSFDQDSFYNLCMPQTARG